MSIEFNNLPLNSELVESLDIKRIIAEHDGHLLTFTLPTRSSLS